MANVKKVDVWVYNNARGLDNETEEYFDLMDNYTSAAGPQASDVDCLTETPTVQEMMDQITLTGKILIPVMLLVTICTFGIFVEEISFINRNFASRRRRGSTMTILAVFSVFTFTSLFAVLVPRSSVINELVAAVYFSYCLYHFTKLVPAYFGGSGLLYQVMRESAVHPRTPPCCCCIFCLPKEVAVTQKTYRNLKLLVLQTAIVKPIHALLTAVIWANGSYNPGQISPKGPALYLSIINLSSSLLAVYGLVQLLDFTEKRLKSWHIKSKLCSLQLVLIITSVLNLICSFIVGLGIVPCVTPFSAQDRATRLYHFATVFIMLPLALLARRFYVTAEDCDDTVVVGVDDEGNNVFAEASNLKAELMEVIYAPKDGKFFIKRQPNNSEEDVRQEDGELSEPMKDFLNLPTEKCRMLNNTDHEDRQCPDEPVRETQPTVC